MGWGHGHGKWLATVKFFSEETLSRKELYPLSKKPTQLKRPKISVIKIYYGGKYMLDLVRPGLIHLLFYYIIEPDTMLY